MRAKTIAKMLLATGQINSEQLNYASNYDRKMTLLHKVAQAGQLDMVELFLSMGSKVDKVDAWGRTVLHVATHG